LKINGYDAGDSPGSPAMPNALRHQSLSGGALEFARGSYSWNKGGTARDAQTTGYRHTRHQSTPESDPTQDFILGGHKVSVNDPSSSMGVSTVKAISPEELSNQKEEQSISSEEHIQQSPTEKTLTPRADRIGAPISVENAQGLLPPSACVFVAKYVHTIPVVDPLANALPFVVLRHLIPMNISNNLSLKSFKNSAKCGSKSAETLVECRTLSASMR
jgi:hypothetical protein